MVYSALKRILIEVNGHLRLDREFSPVPGMPHPRQVVFFLKDGNSRNVIEGLSATFEN